MESPDDIVGHKTFSTGELCPETGFVAAYVSRCKRFLSRRFLRNVIADHRVERR